MEYNEKQQAIIDIAEKLFSVNGFDGTSVRDIAHEAGVNVAMIAYYFGSKEKLMEAVFERKSTNLRIKVENLLSGGLSHLEKVYVLIEDYIEKFLSQQELHKIMLREQLVESGTPLAGIIHDLKVRNLASIKKLVHEGQKSGEFKKNIDIPMIMSTMVGTVSQIITSQRLYREVNNMQEATEQEFQKHIKKKLNIHLKNLFKAMLTHEE